MPTARADDPLDSAQLASMSSMSSGRTRRSRIQFPDGNVLEGEHLEARLPVSLETVPDNNVAQYKERRRTRSTNTPHTPGRTASYSRAQFADSGRPQTSYRRAVSHTFDRSNSIPDRNGSTPQHSRTSTGSPPELAGNGEVEANILADLQKALQYKSRVEERLRAAKSKSNSPSPLLPSSSSPSSESSNPFLPKPAFSHSESLVDQDVDFSPSTGKIPMHPIPMSANDGATLDWSGAQSDEEKRERKWSMHLPRKSSKDKHTSPVTHKGIIEKQASLYSDKLTRIREKANSQTIRKADIIKDQLRRRYSLLKESSEDDGDRLDLSKVALWFSEQSDASKARINEKEPMYWLRHLLQKSGKTAKPRSPWYISAYILEEYKRNNSRSNVQRQNTGGLPISDAISDTSSIAKYQPSVSHPMSLNSLELSSMRKKSDDLISFEPMVQSGRNSIAGESRNSAENRFRQWRHSLSAVANESSSPHGSLQSHVPSVSVEQHSQPEPSSTLGGGAGPLQNVVLKRRAHQVTLHSDDGGHSSPGDSLSESYTGNGDKPKRSHDRKRSRFHLSLDLKAGQSSTEDMKRRSVPPSLLMSELRTDALDEARLTKSMSLPSSQREAPLASTESALSPKRHLSSPNVIDFAQHGQTFPRRRTRVSLPSSLRSTSKLASPSQRPDIHDMELNIEYARKKETLETLKARNARIKFLLQTACKSLIEYDDTQQGMADKLGLSYSRLPPEVLEAFNHDPAAVTGKTRRLSGWRAVEDIHSRRNKQKKILIDFLASKEETVAPLSVPGDGIYGNAINTLSEYVEHLHRERSAVLLEVRKTSELLATVKKLRDQVKPEFDSTGVDTSANYPELVRLESLFDEYVNRKNQLWKLAEAVISFVLTSLAPIMKTFGRPIWNELHDFLVIPIYRNNFSGEEHWYPVSFPRRSSPHWLRIFIFSTSAPLCLKSGFYIFLSLLTEGYYLRIPSFVPRFLIYLSFSSLMCLFAFSLLFLLIGVLCEVAIVLWWSAWIMCIVK